MKGAITLLLFFLSSVLYSQTKEYVLVIKDLETNLPIEDVTAFIGKTKQNFISNENGEVTFTINGVSIIQLSHSAYQSVSIRSTTLNADKNIVLLQKNTKDLDEIIVTKQHPQKILKSLIENSSKKLTVPCRLKVYSREFMKINDKYTYYNDGLMNFQLYGKDKNFSSTILVEQNRSYGMVTEHIQGDALGYNLNDIMENYYNFKYLNILLLASAKKEYDFLLKSYSKNNDYNIMIITPIDHSSGIKDDFTIIYDFKKKVIIEVSAILNPQTLVNQKTKKTVGAKNIYKSFFKTIYKYDGQNYYLLSSKEEIAFEKTEKKITTDFEVKNAFIVTNYSNQKFTYKESEVFKDKTLYNKKNTILSNYWNTSGMTATEEEQNIIDSIEGRHQ